MLTPDNPYYGQVRLMVGVLPFVARERCFALKGGTAINLFVRDLPRLVSLGRWMMAQWSECLPSKSPIESSPLGASG